MKATIRRILGVGLGMLALGAALPASANTITYSTVAGATTSGGPVDATATFTTGAGTLMITLTDLLANPTDVAQLVSDLDFTLSGGQTSGSLDSSSGQEITINGDGSYSLGATVATGWALNNNVAGGLQLDALGTAISPSHLIIGGPGAGNVYSAANGSIAANGPHNPFLNGTATFIIDIAGLTASDSITGAVFSFGTTAGIDVPGVPGTQVPEPATLSLLGLGLVGLGLARRRKAV